MGIQSHLEKFHNKIKLGHQDEEYKKARDRDDSITAEVKKAFTESNHAVIEDFIQGSLAPNVALGVKPLNGDHDIDRAIVISEANAPENPVDPKKVALKVLEDRGFKNAKIKRPCVTADYTSESLHIDYPVYKEDSGVYYLAVGKNGSDEANRRWEMSDPHGLLEWIADTSTYGNEATTYQPQFRRCIRYLKRWREVRFNPDVARKVYSIGLTVLMKTNFVPRLSPDGKPDDLLSLRDTVEQILNSGCFQPSSEDKFRIRVYLPKAPHRDIFTNSSIDTGTQLRNKLTRLSSKLTAALKETDERKQCVLLNEVFGDDFVVPEVNSNSSLIKPATKASKTQPPAVSFSNSRRVPKQPKGFA